MSDTLQSEGSHDRHHRHDQTGQHIAVIQHIFANLGGSRVKADGGDTLAEAGSYSWHCMPPSLQ